MRIHTEDRSHDLCTASAHETGYAQDLSFSDREGDVLEDTRLREIFDLEHFITGYIRTRRIVLAHHAADHIAYDLVHIRFFCRAAADGLPVTHDSDGITVIEYLFHTMRNIDDGDTLRLQLSHDFKRLSVSRSVKAAVGSSMMTVLASSIRFRVISVICC